MCLPNAATFAEAEFACAAIEVQGGGWTLCSTEQLNSGICCGTGCLYDNNRVWTSDIVSPEVDVAIPEEQFEHTHTNTADGCY